MTGKPLMKTDLPDQKAIPKRMSMNRLFSFARMPRIRPTLTLALCAATLAGCAVGPDYVQPQLDVPATYKEDSLWKRSKPADAWPRGAWWSVYKDPELDRLMVLLNKQNLTIAQAEAQYRQAQALLRQAQSSLFPSLSLDANRTRGFQSNTSTSATTQNAFIGNLSWELDVWGGIRRNVEAGEAGRQASAAQLEAIRLSAQAQMATAYLQLIITDRQVKQLEESEALLAESLRLTKNQFAVGIVSDADVAQAESQYKTAQAATVDMRLARSQLEHAIAVSIGQPPSSLTIDMARAEPYLPQIPAGVPSTLLERRPDVASAERKVAQANALIGVAKSAFFPALSISASGGFRNSSFGDLFTVPNRIWSIGPQIALSIFDAGLRSAQTDQAIAVYDETVATYRQKVLTAFQEVEDNLAAQAMLTDAADMQTAALNAAKRAETITMNQYKAGVVSFINVLIAQNTRIAAENTLYNVRKRQFTSSVALIAAIGGQWETPKPEMANNQQTAPVQPVQKTETKS